MYCYLFFTNTVGYFCRVFVFEMGQIMVNYGASRSLRTCKRRAQDSQVKVVTLLNVGHYPNYYCRGVFVFEITKTKTPKFTVKFDLKLGEKNWTEDNLSD